MLHGNPREVTRTTSRLSQEIARVVRRQLRSQGMSQSDLARRMGLHRAWVSRMMHGSVAVTIRELGSAAEILGFRVSVGA